MFMANATKIMLAALLAFLAVLGAHASAGAYCIYNKSDTTLCVRAGRCTGCMQANIAPGGRACCPGGKKGCDGADELNVTAVYKDGAATLPCSGWSTGKFVTNVPAHGWVEIHGKCTTTWDACVDSKALGCKLATEMYTSDGKMIEYTRLQYGDGCGD